MMGRAVAGSRGASSAGLQVSVADPLNLKTYLSRCLLCKRGRIHTLPNS